MILKLLYKLACKFCHRIKKSKIKLECVCGVFWVLFLLRFFFFLISIRPIWMYCWSSACVSLGMTIVTAVQRIPRTILTTMPATVWIVLFNYGWFFLDYLQQKKRFQIKIFAKKQQKYLRKRLFKPLFEHNYSSLRCTGRYSLKAWWGTRHPMQLPTTKAMMVGFHPHIQPKSL